MQTNGSLFPPCPLDKQCFWRSRRSRLPSTASPPDWGHVQHACSMTRLWASLMPSSQFEGSVLAATLYFRSERQAAGFRI